MKALFWGVLFFTLMGCELAGISGGSSEHENVVQAKNISIRVVDGMFHAISGAHVKLIEWRDWAEFSENEIPVKLDSEFISDENGEIHIDSELCEHVSLIAKFPKEKYWGGSVCALSKHSILVVEKSQSICGKTLPNLKLGIYGTSIISKSDNLGFWCMKVPFGFSHADVVVNYEGFWRPLSSDFKVLLIENFEDNSLYTFLHRFNGGSRWWFTINSDSLNHEFFSLFDMITYSDSIHHHSLHVSLIPHDSLQNSKTTIGFDWGFPLSKNTTEYIFKNLSYADTLYFSAKGSGRLGIQMICNSENLVKNIVFEKEINLYSTWTNYAIEMNEFKFVNNNSLNEHFSWYDVNKRCRSTVFYGKNAVDLWLDDLSIGGVRLRDIE